EQRARQEEGANLVAPVIEDVAVPLRMVSLALIAVLEHVRAVEERETVLGAREIRRDSIEYHAYAALVQRVDQVHQILRRPVTRRRREIADALVAPRPVERMLHHGQELDVCEPHLRDVVGEGLRDLAIAEPSPVVPPPPRAEM